MAQENTWRFKVPGEMIARLVLCCALPMFLLTTVVIAETDQNDVASLKAFLQHTQDPMGFLTRNWTGNDPCGDQWYGVYCNQTRVRELHLLNLNLTGTLPRRVGNLSSLTILDLMWNNISGSIPEELGKLKNLTHLLLNGNQFSGSLPESLGYLPNLIRLQVDENKISGSIPQSFQYLKTARHFHMNNNSISGSIPPELGELDSLIHLLLDNNELTGSLPPELSKMPNLIHLQLDNNNLSGSIPSSYYKMSQLVRMSLRNCNLSGTIQNITDLIRLQFLDLSQNYFHGELPPKFPANLNSLILSYNSINGTLPQSIAELENLQFLELRNNNLSGVIPSNLTASVNYTRPSAKLFLDLRENNFETNDYIDYPSNVTFWLNGNPACGDRLSAKECDKSNLNADIKNISNEIPAPSLPVACSDNTCDSSLNQEVAYGVLEQFRICLCAAPLLVGYGLKSPGFSYFPPFEDDFVKYLSDGLKVFPYQLNISEVHLEGTRIRMTIKLFPSTPLHRFNDSEVIRLYNTFTDWLIADSPFFGPAELLQFHITYPYNETFVEASRQGVKGGVVAGIVIGCSLFTAVLVAGGMFLLLARRGHHKGKASNKTDRGHKQIKISGLKEFTFPEMAAATDNFCTSAEVGQGGYGKVYKGLLPDGRVVAIKRAQEGSLQGAHEFYTEIDFLSRLHHRNLVSLFGYCDDEQEQMLVYEYLENGTLRHHLSSSAKRPLDFQARIQIALGAARGIYYLHTEANPPIIHRDIKASNILLDDKNKAKVADFGLSKLAPVLNEESTTPGYISTVVKGTPGYLDPEYFLTHKLTDRSDVYSFGVVLLELITGMQPISHGKNIVREVNMAYEAGMMLSLVDPQMGSYPSEALEPLIRLALSCCNDYTESRPPMAEVVRQLEDILRATSVPESLSGSDVAGMAIDDIQRYKSSQPNIFYQSADSDPNDLLSGTIQEVSPR